MRFLLGLAFVCGAFVPGPCTFDAQREFDCSLGDPCARNFACADDGYCKSADIACLDGEARCEYPGLERVAICVKEEDLLTSKTHCGACFTRCLGAGSCGDGTCEGAPAASRCLRSRGNFDCNAGDACVGDTTGADEGVCAQGAAGVGRILDGCARESDCEGGLCVQGVCTRTCDFGCAFATACDAEAAPGGVCVPIDDEVCR